jgi:SulP family sulfate permease
MNRATLSRFLPFLAWFPLPPGALRADLVAGLTVALVLVPQSMAYAQLAGLAPVYGLYTAFLPVLVAALFGSSRQLATGPVAVVSLLTASALAPLAATGSDAYVALAVMLALLVGLIQLALGVLRLGVLVNFLSHPVIAGFSSAAAIIIALSQLDKLLGVPRSRSSSFLADVWGVLAQWGDTHGPTLAFGLGSLAAMLLVKRVAPKLPGVLIVVAGATAISALTGFERTERVALDAIGDAQARALAEEVLQVRQRIVALTEQRSAAARQARRLAKGGADAREALALSHRVDLLAMEIEDLARENRVRERSLRQYAFTRSTGADGAVTFAAAPVGADALWRIRRLDQSGILLSGGGEVVGTIPAGLPTLALPKIDFAVVGQLLSSALVIALVGFMEAISIAKAMAARTRQRLDANQELIGQGLANLAGALTQCFPASGSFSRSAVALSSGAQTGLASLAAVAVVAATLLFLTPLLYHLPQATLAAVIMMAVASLVNFDALRHAWRARRHDGVAGAATFLATLALAPHLDLGILLGAGLSLVLFLYRTMKPTVALVEPEGAPPADGGARVVAMRFDGQLYFANVPYFEDQVLAIPARHPGVQTILVVADGINQIDASGDEMLRHLADRLRASGIALAFAGLKPQVLEVLNATGTIDHIGRNRIFPDAQQALAALRRGPRAVVEDGAAAVIGR